MSLTTTSSQSSSASLPLSSPMRRRRYSPYTRRTPRRRSFVWTSSCHSKFVAEVKHSGGFDKVTAIAVWEIVKEEMMGGDSPATLKDASNILDMLRFMFPDYMVNPPSMLTFFLDAESERYLSEAIVSDFGKLKLEPKTEPGSCNNIVNDFGKLILELTNMDK